MKTIDSASFNNRHKISRFINESSLFLKNLPRLHNPLFKNLKRKICAKLEQLTKNHIFLIESNYYNSNSNSNRKILKNSKIHQLLLNKRLNKAIPPPPIVIKYTDFIDHHDFELPYWNIENLNDISDNFSVNINNSSDNIIDMRFNNFNLSAIFLKFTDCNKLLTSILNPNEYLFQQYFVELKHLYYRLYSFIGDNQITIERALEILNSNYSYNKYIKNSITLYVLFQTNTNKLGYTIVNLSQLRYTTDYNIYIDKFVELQNIGVKYNLSIQRQKYSLAIFTKRSSLDYILKHMEKLNETTQKMIKLNIIKYHDYIDTL
jgi:hypothetical protein